MGTQKGCPRQSSSSHGDGTGAWQHSQAPERVEQFASVCSSKSIKYASDQDSG